MSKRARRRMTALVFLALLLAGAAAAFRGVQRAQQGRLIAEARREGLAAFARGDLPGALQHLSYVFTHQKNDFEVNIAFAEARARVQIPGGRHIYEALDLYTTHGLKLLDSMPEAPGVDQKRIDILKRLLRLYGQTDLQFELRQTADRLLELAPADVDGLSAKSEILLIERQYEQAMPLAAKLIELEPDELNWRRLQLELMEGQGASPRQLVEQCRAWAAEHQGDGRFRLLTAQRLVEAAREDEARTEMLEMVKLGASSRAILERAVVLLDRLHMADQADQLITRAQADHPREQWVREVMVQRLWRANRVEDALSELAAAERDLGVLESPLLRLKALCLMGSDRADEGRACLEAILASASHAAIQAEADRAWAEAVMTVLDADQLRFEQALEKLRGAIAVTPKDPVLHFLLGDVLVRVYELAPALREYEQAYELDPNWMAAGVAYADALLITGRIREAFDVSRIVFSRFADDRIAPFLLYARSCLALREASGGLGVGGVALPGAEGDLLHDLISMLEQAHEQLPANTQVASLLLRAYADAGERQSASQFLKRLVGSPQTPVEMLLDLAEECRRAKLDGRRELIEAAEVRGGASVPVAFAKAELLHEEGRGTEGLAVINQAMAAPGADPQINRRAECLRAAFMLRIGHTEGAAAVQAIVRDHASSVEAQQFVLGLPALWDDPGTARQAADNLKAALGERSQQVRLAEAAIDLRHHANDQVALARAIVRINGVLEQSPDSLAALSLMAEAMTQHDPPNLDRAIECLELAVSLYPAEPALVVRLIGFLQQRGEFEKAGRFLRQLAPLTSGQPQFASAELRLLQAQGEFESALSRAASLVTEDSAPADQLVLAAIHHRAGEMEKAEAIYDRLMEQPDRPALVVTQVAEFYALTGRFDQGAELLGRLPDAAVPAGRDLLLGTFFQRHGRHEEAGTLLNRAVLQNPNSLDARHELARHCLSIGQRDEARAQAMEGLKIDPANKALRGVLAVADLNAPSGDRKQAIALLREIGAENDALLSMLELLDRVPQKGGASAPTAANLQDARRLLDVHGEFLPAWLMAVTLNVEAGRRNDAIDLARQAVGRFPGQAEPSRWATQLLVEAKRWSEAMAEAQEWRHRPLENPLPADLAIASVAIDLGRPQDAVKQLEPHARQLEADADRQPDRLAIWVRALTAAGRMEQAAKLVQPLLAKDVRWRTGWAGMTEGMSDTDAAAALELLVPHVTGARERLALAARFTQVGRRTGRPDCFDRAEDLALECGEQSEFAADSMVAQGAVAEARGDSAKAEALYRRVLEIQPSHAVALNNLAYVLTRMPGRCEEALALVDKALAQAVDQPDLLDTRSHALICLGRLEEAEQSLARAASARPDDVDIALNLADAKLLLRRLDQAGQLLDEIQQKLRETARPDPRRLARLSALQERLRQSMAEAQS